MRTIRAGVITICAALLELSLLAASAEARVRRHRAPRNIEQDNFTQRGFRLYAGLGGQGYQIEDNDYSYLDDRGSEGMFFLGAAVRLGDEVSLFLEGAGSHHETGIGNCSFGYTHLGLTRIFHQKGWRSLGIL